MDDRFNYYYELNEELIKFQQKIKNISTILFSKYKNKLSMSTVQKLMSSNIHNHKVIISKPIDNEENVNSQIENTYDYDKKSYDQLFSNPHISNENKNFNLNDEFKLEDYVNQEEQKRQDDNDEKINEIKEIETNHQKELENFMQLINFKKNSENDSATKLVEQLSSSSSKNNDIDANQFINLLNKK